MNHTLDFEYLSRIRTAFSLKTGKKTSNILEGDYRSVYRGRSMEFDELALYTPGDNVRDIDWKSSSRAGEILVRRYVAERKHYILFITDAGAKMAADTSGGESKAMLATLTLGTAAYLCDRAGADYACLYPLKNGFDMDMFRSGTAHLESILHRTGECIENDTDTGIEALLTYAFENVRKRKIIVIITDFEGLKRLDSSLLNKAASADDILIVNIDDAYLTDEDAFDTVSFKYADTFFVNSPFLKKAERDNRKKIIDEASLLFKRLGVGFVTVSKEEEITDRVLELFRRDNLNI